jgi:hypothetical protein
VGAVRTTEKDGGQLRPYNGFVSDRVTLQAFPRIMREHAEIELEQYDAVFRQLGSPELVVAPPLHGAKQPLIVALRSMIGTASECCRSRYSMARSSDG